MKISLLLSWIMVSFLFWFIHFCPSLGSAANITLNYSRKTLLCFWDFNFQFLLFFWLTMLYIASLKSWNGVCIIKCKLSWFYLDEFLNFIGILWRNLNSLCLKSLVWPLEDSELNVMFLSFNSAVFLVPGNNHIDTGRTPID